MRRELLSSPPSASGTTTPFSGCSSSPLAPFASSKTAADGVAIRASRRTAAMLSAQARASPPPSGITLKSASTIVSKAITRKATAQGAALKKPDPHRRENIQLALERDVQLRLRRQVAHEDAQPQQSACLRKGAQDKPMRHTRERRDEVEADQSRQADMCIPQTLNPSLRVHLDDVAQEVSHTHETMLGVVRVLGHMRQ